MRVRVDDPTATADLAEFLRSRIGAIVVPSGQEELEVSLLGSYSIDALRHEIELALRRWELMRQRPGLTSID